MRVLSDPEGYQEDLYSDWKASVCGNINTLALIKHGVPHFGSTIYQLFNEDYV